MKKIHYNSRLARIILAPGYGTIMFFGFVISKRPGPQPGDSCRTLDDYRTTENHEAIHVAQYWPCVAIGAIIALPLAVLLSPWFILLPPTLYYLLYLAEAAVSFVHHLFSTRRKDAAGAADKAYHASAMEMEAYEHEADLDYLKTRKWWENFRYYGRL